MKLNAIGVVSSDLKRTVEFYKLIGFMFPDFSDSDQHLEPMQPEGSARLMIDTVEMMKDILGYEPKPANHSACAIEFNSTAELDDAAQRIKDAGHKIVREPWDAFWGQRYCIVSDPDGYLIDLYAKSDK